MQVGTRNVPFVFIRASVSSVRKEPCSIESTPALIADRAARSPWEWAAVLRSRRWASSTIAASSSSVSCGARHVVGERQHAAGGAHLDDVRAVLDRRGARPGAPRRRRGACPARARARRRRSRRETRCCRSGRPSPRGRSGRRASAAPASRPASIALRRPTSRSFSEPTSRTVVKPASSARFA